MKRKFRNGTRHSPRVHREARRLRKMGFTHREIVKKLSISLGSADLWTHGIVLTEIQKRDIQKRRHQHELTEKEKEILRNRLRAYRLKVAYKDADLITKIQEFYKRKGRIPLKREFNSLRVFRSHFGSWNNAIKAAGFEPNPVLFSKKFISKDGHKCDSFAEKIIDDWLYARRVPHERNIPYANTKMTADFSLGSNTLMEFFGLAGVQKKYDELLERKRKVCRERNTRLIEIYPSDLFSKSRLSQLVKHELLRA